ncbi:MAG: 1-acyl-sn-glycerol-3-phosphate acyltransferase [Actinobacteria bacterium]|nr:1-acyl-sn-glycerol-3-phosphate acyltransferase [Actinomycetota bacterium]
MPGSDLNGWWKLGLLIFAPFARLLLRLRVEGIERVPLQGPAILAFNHVSVLDGPVIAIETGRRVRRQIRFLVASEVFDQRVAGWILRRLVQIPIRRGEGDEGALDEAIRTVRSGALAAVAPEGRVSDDPEAGLQRVRTGVARIAVPTGACVVPIGIWGTQARWGHTGFRWGRPLRPHVGISVGGPILGAGDADDPSVVEAFTERLRVALEQQVAEARRLARASG